MIYGQNFDSLPVATNFTVNSGNPVSVNQLGSANQVTYSLADPFDFAYPVLPTGGVGGFGLSNSMPGWYGWGQISTKFAVQQGDQSTGGTIDFGTLSTNLVTGEANRALGLLSTSTTGPSAFGLKLVNNTGVTLSSINLSYLGEVWRQQPRSNSLVFGYYVDAAATAAFSPTNSSLTLVPALDVNFNTNAGGLLILDGSQSSNQVSVAVSNLPIADWTANSALWLVWQQLDSQGSAQGLAIDNLAFSAGFFKPVLNISLSNGGVVVSWPASVDGFALQQNSRVSAPTGWSTVTQPIVVVGSSNTVTVPTTSSATFYRLIR